MKIIQSSKAPEPIGPYSQAIQCGDFFFSSGQISIDPQNNELCLFEGDVARQARQVLKNLENVLEAANLTLANVIKSTIYLISMNDFPKVNEVYATFFKSHRPARSTVEVSGLPKGVAVEIDFIAFRELP